MNLEVFDIIVFISGAALGGILGFIIKSVTTKANLNNPVTQPNQVTPVAQQHEQAKKQVIIDDYFNDTNRHLDTLENQLTELRSRLIKDAKLISSVELKPSKVTAPQTDEAEPAEPPKDYYTQTGSGTLTEGFGLQNTDKNPKEPTRA